MVESPEKQKRFKGESFELLPFEGLIISGILWYLGYLVEVEGTFSEEIILFILLFPHTAHPDILAGVKAARGKRENMTPVTKGDYWRRPWYRLLLGLLFSGKPLFTKSEKTASSDIRETQASMVAELRKIIAERKKHTTVFIFPEGGRNSKTGKIHSGPFVAAAQSYLEDGQSADLQPVELQNVPQILTGGDLSITEIRKILSDAKARRKTGQRETIKVIVHPPIKPAVSADSSDIQPTVDTLASIMLGEYKRTVQHAMEAKSDYSR